MSPLFYFLTKIVVESFFICLTDPFLYALEAAEFFATLYRNQVLVDVLVDLLSPLDPFWVVRQLSEH